MLLEVKRSGIWYMWGGAPLICTEALRYYFPGIPDTVSVELSAKMQGDNFIVLQTAEHRHYPGQMFRRVCTLRPNGRPYSLEACIPAFRELLLTFDQGHVCMAVYY